MPSQLPETTVAKPRVNFLAAAKPRLNFLAAFRTAVETMLPKFLFAPGTLKDVADRLTREFLASTGDEAVARLEPLYRFDARPAAKAVRVPVRGIATDLHPGNVEANRAYLRDYDAVTFAGFGHYPMLEAPEAFTAALSGQLASLGL